MILWKKLSTDFFCDKIIVDVMSTKGIGWAPSNKWIWKPGFASIQEYCLDGTSIKILPSAFFLATKFGHLLEEENQIRF